jgi:hypothetical protein
MPIEKIKPKSLKKIKQKIAFSLFYGVILAALIIHL